jgi:hypothetical protein
MTATTPGTKLTTPVIAFVAAMLALALMTGAVLTSFVNDGPDRNPAISPSTLKVADSGTLRDLIPEHDRGEFDQYMADPNHRATFVDAFQAGLNGEKPQDSTASLNSSSTAQNVLAYGFDRDHIWITASYADIAKGLITGAVAYCKTRVPAIICTAAGNWLKSLANGYAPLNSHGVWGAVYWNRYAGGRW